MIWETIYFEHKSKQTWRISSTWKAWMKYYYHNVRSICRCCHSNCINEVGYIIRCFVVSIKIGVKVQISTLIYFKTVPFYTNFSNFMIRNYSRIISKFSIWNQTLLTYNKNMNKISYLLLILLLMSQNHLFSQDLKFVNYVNPMVGTKSMGHTFRELVLLSA